MELKDFLLEYTSLEESKYFNDMSGWPKFQPVLADITDIDEIRKRLKYELDYSHRDNIIERLIQKFNKLRSKEIQGAYIEYKYSKREEEHR